MPVPLNIDSVVHSRHYRERTEPIKYIILHCSVGTPQEQIKRLDNLGLSAHYIIGRDSTITEVLPPEYVAYHAGKSRWQNSEETSLNGCSIGIEIEASALGQNKADYHRGIMRKIYSLLHFLCMKYKIRPENILGHSDIAPTRKPDPGACFPWKTLYVYNFGVWYNLLRLSPETDETTLLQIIGYDTANLPAARYAFCRHFIPEEVFVESDIFKLLTFPYPADFQPKDQENYLRILRATAAAYVKARQKRYWYLER